MKKYDNLFDVDVYNYTKTVPEPVIPINGHSGVSESGYTRLRIDGETPNADEYYYNELYHSYVRASVLDFTWDSTGNHAVCLYVTSVYCYTEQLDYGKTEYHVQLRGSMFTYLGPQQGTFIEYVTSPTPNVFPDNSYTTSGEYADYWYVSAGSETQYSQGNFVGIVRSDNPDTFPANGKHTDGYWYVRL